MLLCIELLRLPSYQRSAENRPLPADMVLNLRFELLSASRYHMHSLIRSRLLCRDPGLRLLLHNLLVLLLMKLHPLR